MNFAPIIDTTRHDTTRHDTDYFCLLTTKRKKFYAFLFITLSILLSIWGLRGLFRNGLAWSDMGRQWRTCVYTLRGISIYSLRSGENFIAEIGEIGPGFHASPWGCLLENIFYGGFFSFKTAKIYFIAANIFVLFLTSCILYKNMQNFSRTLGIFAFIVSILSVDFFMAIHEGNAGGMICAFLLIAWLMREKHPYISGLLISFAMVKPQDALIICLLFLLAKNIRPLIIGAIIDIAAWFSVSLLTHTSMINLVKDFLFTSDRAEQGPFMGIFTLAFENANVALFMSMLFGIIFVLIVHKKISGNVPKIFEAYPAFMAITFWCYSFENDCYSLILPACLCIYLMLKTGRVFWGLCALFCLHGFKIRWSLFTKIFHALNIGANWHAYRTLYGIGIIAIGIFMCIELRRLARE